MNTITPMDSVNQEVWIASMSVRPVSVPLLIQKKALTSALPKRFIPY